MQIVDLHLSPGKGNTLVQNKCLYDESNIASE